jgi:hypothetical protein
MRILMGYRDFKDGCRELLLNFGVHQYARRHRPEEFISCEYRCENLKPGNNRPAYGKRWKPC